MLFALVVSSVSIVLAPAKELEVRCEPHADRVVVTVAGAPFTVYRFTGDTKPFLYPILTPKGFHATRRWPEEVVANEEQDHPHHRGSWFAHGAVDGHDFWTGEGGKSRIEVVELLAAEGDTFKLRQRWIHESKPILDEIRTMRFAATEDSRTIDFEITLSPSGDDVRFGDTKEGTFALRLAETLRLKGDHAEGQAWNSAGAVGADIWGKRAKYVAYSGPLVDGENRALTTVVVFDAPTNPRHPTWWHARDYGLFAANPFGVHDFEGKPAGTGDLELAKGEKLEFRYRLVLVNDKATEERIRTFEPR